MPRYIATMRINNINGVIISPRQIVEMPANEARKYLSSGALQTILGAAGETEVVTDRDIPEDFPHYSALTAVADGTPTFRTLDDLKKASDEDIESKPGIGVASRREIRIALQKKKYQ